ncbi:tyrosine-tRNA ligase [Gorgonomyces haynaldii]|nr:tyrosine-tRNA ligase [Gorgonomyces haynaldii]
MVLERLRDRRLFQEAAGSLSGKVYCGFDPTAPSLHVGNLATLTSLLQFQLQDHHVCLLVGGATGQIGDPSGKSKERVQLDDTHVRDNSDKITNQLQTVFKRMHEYTFKKTGKHLPPVQMVNNRDWFQQMSVLDFIGDVGRRVRLSHMLARDSVKSRLASPEGISFTEFTYQLLQAYDFYHLYKHHSCTIQIGGSDQWGNITAGMDLIKKYDPLAKPGCVVIPLITTPSGHKFGKSEGNAVWLDPNMVSPFDLYQFFCKTEDVAVENYLHHFTLLSSQEIQEIMAKHTQDPKQHLAQRLLALEVTELVHGEKMAQQARVKTEILFDQKLELDADTIIEAFEDDKRLIHMQTKDLDIVDLFTGSGLVQSKSQVRKLMQSGGLYINHERVQDNRKILASDVYQDRLIVLRTGKGNYKLIVNENL